MLVADVRMTQSADDASFTSELLAAHERSDPRRERGAVAVTSHLRETTFVDTATTILAFARIPARMVHGFPLSKAGNGMHSRSPWLEVHDGDQWRYFNPATGEQNMFRIGF